MEKFNVLEAIAAPLSLMNIDTDMIIPKQFLKTIKRTGLGQHLFYELRYNNQGQEKPEFILNQPAYRQTEILVAGENFGCGSSREHAPWALLDFGIRCVIASSFADIFYNNCFQNGILPLVLPAPEVAALMEALAQNPSKTMKVDLPQQTIAYGNHMLSFNIDSFRKECLLNGLDSVGLTLKKDEAITEFEQGRLKNAPWYGA
jgi:3-isopropylmalate/(R)-2-methylmalate dehydratase small subunit